MSEQAKSDYDPVPETAREALERWDRGESVFTIEMGPTGIPLSCATARLGASRPMSYPNVRSSTGSPEIFSGGLFPTSSGVRLSLNQWLDDDGGSTDFSGHFGELFRGRRGEFSFQTSASGLDALYRLLGYVLVSIIPPEGMEEALSHLKRVYEYHTELPQERRLIAPRASKSGIATVTRSLERKPLVL